MEEITLSELAQHLQLEASLRELLESLKGDNPNLSNINIVIDDEKASNSGDKRKKLQNLKGKGKKKEEPKSSRNGQFDVVVLKLE